MNCKKFVEVNNLFSDVGCKALETSSKYIPESCIVCMTEISVRYIVKDPETGKYQKVYVGMNYSETKEIDADEAEMEITLSQIEF